MILFSHMKTVMTNTSAHIVGSYLRRLYQNETNTRTYRGSKISTTR
jgi:hypothetical protein